ncbi:MAG: transposase [Magnetovibrionaceae bacterium]
MARLARIVLPNLPHHVTQRGNGRAQTFFGDEDYRLYKSLLAEQCHQRSIKVLGWCLMPNHVHLILTPPEPDALRGALSRVHRAYAGHIHARETRTGHFWQGRFGCVAMDDDHLVAAMAYVALNPVRASLADRPQDWRWSCVKAYRKPGFEDGLTDSGAVAPYRTSAMALIKAGLEDERFDALRRAETIGRPVGEQDFLIRAEKHLGRRLRPAKRGPKPRGNSGPDGGLDN